MAQKIPILTFFFLALSSASFASVDRKSLQFSPSCGNVAVDAAISEESGFHATLGGLEAFTLAEGNVSVDCQVQFQMNIPDGYQATALIIFSGKVSTSNNPDSVVEANAEFSSADQAPSSHFVPLMDNQHFLSNVDQEFKLSNFASLLTNWTECSAKASKGVSASVTIRSYNSSYVSLDDIQASVFYRPCGKSK